MRKPLSLFISILLLIIFPALLPANDIVTDSFEEIEGRGLEIDTNPQGVKVYIDGAERGTTPLILNSLPQGIYQIRLQKEGFNERNFNIILTNTSRLVVSIKMTEISGTVIVSVKGEDGLLPLNPKLTYTSTLNDNSLTAYPAEDNKLSHITNAELNLPAGYRTITARAFGWEDASFIVLVEENKTVNAEIVMKRAAFKMKKTSQSRRRFNPLNYGNLGVTEFSFEVTAHAEGRFNVIDSNGEAVYTSDFKHYNTWSQTESWNGKDSESSHVPEGIYKILVEADGVSGEKSSLQYEIEVNYSAGIYPQSLDSGFSGLIFAPAPDTLPHGSYQFSAGFLFGNFISHNVPENEMQKQHASFIFPFKIDLRVSPLKNLEIASIFNINPQMEDQTGWGISGSVKYNFFESAIIPLSFAAGFSYAWADENGEYPLGTGKGAGLAAPLSYDINYFTFIFCPAAFWRGPEGIIPELHLSAGTLFRNNLITAGISYRCEIDFENNKNEPKHLAGGEFHITLSNFIISLKGGFWTQNEFTSGFGGLGIGMIF